VDFLQGDVWKKTYRTRTGSSPGRARRRRGKKTARALSPALHAVARAGSPRFQFKNWEEVKNLVEYSLICLQIYSPLIPGTVFGKGHGCHNKLQAIAELSRAWLRAVSSAE
jgi:hypothetical protein